MKITLQQLIEGEACQKQQRRFKRLFGKEVKVTKARCIEHAHRFDFRWAARHLLKPSAYRVFNNLNEVAWQRNMTQRRPVWRAYYGDVRRSAFVCYLKTVKPFTVEYEKVSALAFWKASKLQ